MSGTSGPVGAGGGRAGEGRLRGGSAWPVADLDRIARLRVLAAALPGTAVADCVIDAPFADVWGFITDFEVSVPAFDRDVRRLRVVRADGERLRVQSWARGVPLPVPFDVVLRPGWCWMVSRPRIYVVGMAAEPAGDRTRYAHLEGLVAAPAGPVRTVTRPIMALSRHRHRRHIRRDIDGIERGVAHRRLRPS